VAPSESAQAAAAPSAPAQRAARIHDGYVDFFGYASAAGGWLFCGWSVERWADNDSTVIAHFERGRVEAQVAACWHERADLGRAGTGAVMFLRHAGPSLGEFIGLEVRAGLRRLRLPATRPLTHLHETDLLPRVRELVLGAEGPRRDRLLSLLTRQSYMGHDTLASLPAPVELEIDELILASPAGVVAIGWLLDPSDSVAAIRMCFGSIVSRPLADGWLRRSRPDVIEAVGARLGVTDPLCGFIAYVPANAPKPERLYLEVELKGGEIGYKRLPSPVLIGQAAIRRVLEDVILAPDEIAAAFGDVLGPPLIAINRARLARPRPHAVIDFGQMNPAPVCSVIVPLYGRMDFLMYQLALFSPEDMAAHELIYVLDDPPKKRELLDLAHSVHRRFGIPFRVVALEENLGFAPANNIGLSHARGEYICYLNSDVMPDGPGWLDLMIDNLRSDPGLGIVGARLLFEDGTLQHDGMTFERLPQLANWPFPMHPGKGRRPPVAAPALADAEAVTGACMMLRTALARELGGFDEEYVIGDFEDTDLCLRIRARGLRCATEQRARMYHLERQSQVTPDKMWRMYVTLLNAWTHTRRWFPEQVNPRASNRPE
jgi:GT2 family glycosyltransferase